MICGITNLKFLELSPKNFSPPKLDIKYVSN